MALEEKTLNQIDYIGEMAQEILTPLQAKIRAKYKLKVFINFEWDMYRNGVRFRLTAYDYRYKAILDEWPEEIFSIDWKRLHLYNVDIKNHKELDLSFLKGAHLYKIEYPEITEYEMFLNSMRLGIKGKMNQDDAEDLIERTKAYDFLSLDQIDFGHLPRSILDYKGYKLTVKNANISRIPRFLLDHPHIFRLDLSMNKIKEIPRWIDQIPGLRKLYLVENKIDILPKFIFDTDLWVVQVSRTDRGKYFHSTLRGRRPKGWKRKYSPWFKDINEIPKEYELCRILFELGMKPPKKIVFDEPIARLPLPLYLRKRTELKWISTLKNPERLRLS